ncbi:hypothetical protein Trydic_g11242 [Trypoxylus dichotomus]
MLMSAEILRSLERRFMARYEGYDDEDSNELATSTSLLDSVGGGGKVKEIHAKIGLKITGARFKWCAKSERGQEDEAEEQIETRMMMVAMMMWKEEGKRKSQANEKGDPDFGIPSLFPVKIPTVEINPVNLTLYDVFTDDIKDIEITKPVLDFKNRKAAFSASAKTINGFAQNYTPASGELLSLPVSGHGKFKATIGRIGTLLRKQND